jgi:type I restriction enzyme S subunit
MSWKKVRLGDICTIEKGATGILKAIPGQFPLVTTSEERKTHNEFQFDDAAVIVPLVSGTGHGHASIKRIHYQKGKFALGTILCAIIPKDKKILSAEYLYRFLDLNKDRELVSRMRGMANVTLPMKEIANIEIPLPSLDAQLDFVKKYKHLETQNTELSAELSYQQDIVRQMRQAFLREALQGKLTEKKPSDGHARDLLAKIKTEKQNRKDKLLPLIKEDEKPFEIPESWIWCRLSEISLHITDGEHLTPTKRLSGRLLLSAKNIRDGYIDYDKVDYISEEDFQKSIKRCHPEKYDILIVSVGGTIGRSTVMLDDSQFAIVRSVALIKPFVKAMAGFLKYVLDSPILQKEISGRSWGTAQPCLYINQIKELTIPLPPLAEQQRIVNKLNELMKYCDDLEHSIAKSQTETHMLLQQVLREALSGEAIVKQRMRPVIQTPQRAAIDFKLTDEELRDMLGGYILTKADLQKDFGHLKLIKHMVTVEYGAETSMPTHYIQFPNGPYDKQFMEGIGYRLEKKQWFKETKKGSSYTYTPLAKAGEIEELFNNFFADKKEQIDFLIGLMNKAKPKQAEIIATVYAVWNDLLINQMDASIDKIKLYFFKWSEKKKAFKPEQVEGCYKWMNEVGLVPKGTGRIIMRFA